MKPIFISILCVELMFSLNSCSESPSNLYIKMKDGNVISLRQDNEVYYETEDEFQRGLSFGFRMNYSFLANSIVNLMPDSTINIVGYDDRYLGLWEKASFGNWIKDYGLESNKSYYIASCVYVIYLPLAPDGYYLFPMPESQDSIGFVPSLGYKGSIVETDKSAGFSIARSGSRYIGYDDNGNIIALEIPQLNKKITWKFLIKRNGWD